MTRYTDRAARFESLQKKEIFLLLEKSRPLWLPESRFCGVKVAGTSGLPLASIYCGEEINLLKPSGFFTYHQV